MPTEKTYRVTREFTDARGKKWTPGQDYSSDDAETQVEAGNVESTEDE